PGNLPSPVAGARGKAPNPARGCGGAQRPPRQPAEQPKGLRPLGPPDSGPAGIGSGKRGAQRPRDGHTEDMRVLLIALLLAQPALAQPGSTSWPTYHRDAQRSGAASDVSLSPSVSLQWQSPQLDGDVY